MLVIFAGFSQFTRSQSGY